MSEPSQWGPPRSDAAPQPDSPLPDCSPSFRPPPGSPAPGGAGPDCLPPHDTDPDGPGAGSPDGRHRPPVPPTDDYDDDYSSGRPRRRGQALRRPGAVARAGRVRAAVLLTYQTLASVDIISADPLGSMAGQVTMPRHGGVRRPRGVRARRDRPRDRPSEGARGARARRIVAAAGRRPRPGPLVRQHGAPAERRGRHRAGGSRRCRARRRRRRRRHHPGAGEPRYRRRAAA